MEQHVTERDHECTDIVYGQLFFLQSTAPE